MIEIIGIDILNQKLQQPVKEIKIESFSFNGQATEINTIYLKFDSWISLFFDDGVLFIREGLRDKLNKIISDGNTIEYKYLDSIEHIIDFNDINKQKLIKVSKDNSGLRLVFEYKKEMILNQQMLNNSEYKQPTIEIKDRP